MSYSTSWMLSNLGRFDSFFMLEGFLGRVIRSCCDKMFDSVLDSLV